MSNKEVSNNTNPYDIVEMRKNSNVIRNNVSYNVDPSKSSLIQFQHSKKNGQDNKPNTSSNINTKGD